MVPDLTPLRVLADTLAEGERAWLVGGAVRDQLLGRPTPDYDIALASPAGPEGTRRLARTVARAAGAHPFLLSDSFGAWRVTAHDHSWQLDITPLQGETIEQDLGNRDLTVNAIARPVGQGSPPAGGEPVDPFGGIEDLEHRRLRMVSVRSFANDPLRVVRLPRFATELEFEADPETVQTARSHASGLRDVAAERIFAELRRIVCADAAPRGLELLREVGAMAVVLPELEELHGIEQSDFHHLDVYGHTLATLRAAIDLERDPAPVLGQEHAAVLASVLQEPLANEMTRGEALRFGALLHDIAKARTRGVSEQGRVTFFGHDVAGAELSAEILTRLRASERLVQYVAALTRHHLRLGFLVHERPLSRRAVYGYLSTCAPVEVEVTVLSCADRLSTLGRSSERAVALHLELARELIGDALAWRARPPRPPMRGDELAKALGMPPGPELGALLAELTAAAYAGEIDGEDQTLAHARAWLEAASRSPIN